MGMDGVRDGRNGLEKHTSFLSKLTDMWATLGADSVGTVGNSGISGKYERSWLPVKRRIVRAIRAM